MIEIFSGPIFIVCLMLFVVLYLITSDFFGGRPAFFEDSAHLWYDVPYNTIYSHTTLQYCHMWNYIVWWIWYRFINHDIGIYDTSLYDTVSYMIQNFVLY